MRSISANLTIGLDRVHDTMAVTKDAFLEPYPAWLQLLSLTMGI
jgi:hypothetical protein